MFRFQVSTICKSTASRQNVDLLIIRHLLGGIRIYKEIPYRVANAASRPNNDLYIRRSQRNRRISVDCAVRRIKDSTTSIHARSYLFTTSTQSSCKHAAAAGARDED